MLGRNSRITTPIDRLIQQITEAEADAAQADSPTVRFDRQIGQLRDVAGELKAAVASLVNTEPLLVRTLIASLVESIELDVEPREVSEKHTRYDLIGGEITLKPGFNLICAS